MSPNTTKVPAALKIVAIIFIITGVLSLIDIFYNSFTRSRLPLNLGGIGFFIGLGLLRFSPGWRRCALAILSLRLIFLPTFVLLVICAPEAFPVTFLGHPPASISRVIVLLFVVGIFVLTEWQHRVLRRYDIVQLFQQPISRYPFKP